MSNSTSAIRNRTEIAIFDASPSYDPDGFIVNYTWDFGDCTPIVTVPYPIMTHIYTSSGTYEALLIVTDNEGLTDAETAIVTVSPAPVGGVAVPILVPIDTMALLTPYIGLALTIIAATTIVAGYVDYVKRRKKKQ